MMERRYNAAHRMKVTKREDGTTSIGGYAAVYYRDGDPTTEFELWPGVRERVVPGAFDRAIRERQDVRGLFNHDPNHVLGRVQSGTLALSTDGIGLRYELALPDTQAGRDVAVMIERGDVSGSSFAFNVVKQSWVRGDDFDVRELADLDLFDVSPVTFPAYDGTSVGLRAARTADEAKAAHEAWRRSLLARPDQRAAVTARARVVEIGA